MVEALDANLCHYAEVLLHDMGVDVRHMTGAGAAGGLGAGAIVFCHATVRSGASLVLEMFRFEELLEAADVVLTGEGSIDAQLAFGKAVGTVASLAQRHQVPVIAFAGRVAVEPEKLLERGIAAAIPIAPGPMGEEESMGRAGELLQVAVERTVRVLQLGEMIGCKWAGQSLGSA